MWPIIGAIATAAVFAFAGWVQLQFAPEIKQYCEHRPAFEFQRKIARDQPLSTYRLAGWICLGCKLLFLILAAIKFFD